MKLLLLGRGKTGAVVDQLAHERTHDVRVLTSKENANAAALTPDFLRDFDVVHFNFGSTVAPQRTAPDEPGAKPRSLAARKYSALLEQLDLRLLARAGKAIFVTVAGLSLAFKRRILSTKTVSPSAGR